jgi:effector-binding domain-containing protein
MESSAEAQIAPTAIPPSMCDVFRIITTPEQKILTVRRKVRVADLQASIREALDEVGVFMVENGIAIKGPPLAYFNGTSGGEADVEFGYGYEGGDVDDGNVRSRKLPMGRAAMALNLGSYASLNGAHERMLAWIVAKGYSPSPAMWEFYLNDPVDTPEESLRTQIFWPTV